MLIRDMFQLYGMKHGEPDNLFLILKDYVLDSRLNRDTLNAQILLDIAECYPYYNETTVLKYAIDNFFKTNQYSIKNLADTVFADFNMLYDYEVHTEEDIEDNRDITEARTDAKDTSINEIENVTRDLDTRQIRDLDTSNHEEVNSTENSETENTISAYNSVTYQPRDKSITERTVDTETNSTETEDETITNAEDETTAKTKTQVTDFDERENTRTDDDLVRDRDVYEYGLKNGHTYQELIEQQRKIAEFNIYKWIIKRLTKEICLQIW